MLQILYTLSKGDFSIFLEWSDLKSTKHQTAAEVNDAYRVCQAAMEEFKVNISSIPVDNAAKGVAGEVAQLFEPRMKVLVSRDPSHCVDLLSKDLANTLVVKRVIEEAKEVFELPKIDRVAGIFVEAIEEGEVNVHGTVVAQVDTRMNLTHDFIRGARKQHDNLQILSGNPKWQVYLRERSPRERARLTLLLNRCRDPARWERMDMLTDALTCHFKLVHKLCSTCSFPITCYPLLIQALRNEINQGMSVGDGQFDEVLGEGARAEVAGMIRERFNMDGRDPSGRKVGLLDRHQLMAYLVDPYCHEWRDTFLLNTNKAELVREMIEMYIPLDEDESDTARQRVKEEFMVSTVVYIADI